MQLSPWGRAKRHADRIGWPPWNRQRRLSQVVKRLLERGKRYLGRSWKILEDLGRSRKILEDLGRDDMI